MTRQLVKINAVIGIEYCTDGMVLVGGFAHGESARHGQPLPGIAGHIVRVALVLVPSPSSAHHLRQREHAGRSYGRRRCYEPST